MKTQANEQFMRIAIALSENNVKQNLGGPFGAVIVKDGEVVAASANRVIVENDPTAHAEITTIRAACQKLNTYDLSGCEIYTSCEPCPMCLGAIYWARIDKIYYANTKHDAAAIGFDDYLIYREMSSDIHKRKIEFVQLLRDEASKAFIDWDLAEGHDGKNY
jgi:guanine deaminase